jgi:hypothetical protein
VAEWTNALGLAVLLGSGCRKIYIYGHRFCLCAPCKAITRVVQKVCGQLRFYHFNWVNIYIPYTKMFVVKFQFKVDFDKFSIFE